MNSIIIQTPKGPRVIGPGQPVFIVAEMSANHNQSYDRAVELVETAADCGVDAVKLQTYTADTMTIDCDRDYFQINEGQWKGQSLYQLYQLAYTPWEWQPKLRDLAEKRGLTLFSTPFDETAVDFLEKNGINHLYKVASFELIDLPLLRKIGKTGRPVIASCGMASEEEIKLAVEALNGVGNLQVALLHCLSSYPAKPDEMNLATIPDMMKKFKVAVGLSDHSLDEEVARTAVSLGASIVEKHFTKSRSEEGPDAAFSLEPAELKSLVKAIRQQEKAEPGKLTASTKKIIGSPTYGPGGSQGENKIFRRSLFAVKEIKRGEKFSKENIRSIRPGYGLNPRYYDEVIGQAASQEVQRGTPLEWELIG